MAELSLLSLGDVQRDQRTGAQRDHSALGVADPVRMQEDFASLDLISHGRAEVIVGRSAFSEPFTLFGYGTADYEALRPKRPGGRGFVVSRDAFEAGPSRHGAIMVGSAGEITGKLLDAVQALGLDRILAQVVACRSRLPRARS